MLARLWPHPWSTDTTPCSMIISPSTQANKIETISRKTRNPPSLHIAQMHVTARQEVIAIRQGNYTCTVANRRISSNSQLLSKSDRRNPILTHFGTRKSFSFRVPSGEIRFLSSHFPDFFPPQHKWFIKLTYSWERHLITKIMSESVVRAKTFLWSF